MTEYSIWGRGEHHAWQLKADDANGLLGLMQGNYAVCLTERAAAFWAELERSLEREIEAQDLSPRDVAGYLSEDQTKQLLDDHHQEGEG